MNSVRAPLLLCFFVVAPFYLFCQKTYQFRLVDQVSKQPIPYATVGLVMQNTGASTDSEGMLSLKVSSNQADSILISCLGYENKRLALTILSDQKLNTIGLESKVYAIQAVEIKPNEFSKEVLVLNKIVKSKYSIGYLVGEYAQQAARKFTITEEQKGSLLRSVSYLVKRRPQHQISTFKIRIYTMDKTSGRPGSDLLTTPIIRTVHSDDEIIKIDLTKYNITLPGEGFFVAFEWLKTKDNSIQMQRFDGSFSEAFIPLLGSSKEKSEAGWTLNYKNEWENKHQFDLAISVEISPAKQKN